MVDGSLAVCTEDEQRLKRIMKQPVMVDLRNVYRPGEMAELGFLYSSIGREKA